MTTSATAPDMYSEVALVGIIQGTGSETQWGAMIEDISGIDIGDKDVDFKELINGGRAARLVPQASSSITMKLFPVTCKLDNTGAVQWFYPQSTADSTQSILVDATRTRAKHAIIMTMATILPATAGAEIAADGTTTSLRMQIVNAYMTSFKPSFDDKAYGVEVTFKWAPFNKSGTANERHESSDGSVALPAATTSSTAFV